MKDITIIIPVNEVSEDFEPLYLEALNSVKINRENYKNGKLKVTVVGPMDCMQKVCDISSLEDFEYIANNGETDFCSQINYAVEHIKTPFFSILEYDDNYTDKWFYNVDKYYYGNESISIFLPVNLYHDGNGENWEYGNTMGLTPAFMTANENDTDDIGIINYERLEKCSLFNLTGSVFNTKDFKEVGMYKPSMKVSFNYELMLRMTKKGLKLMVIPKEGYIHVLGRKGSLSDQYIQTLTQKDIDKWFNLAIRECKYKEDRAVSIDSLNEEDLK